MVKINYMKLELNKIYKVKEGHEGKCDSFKSKEGKYIKIIGFIYDILDENKKWVDYCESTCCFKEDDLEPIEEEVKNIAQDMAKSLSPAPVSREMHNSKFLEDLEEEEVKGIDKMSIPPKDTVKEINLLDMESFAGVIKILGDKINELIVAFNTLKGNNDSTSH